MMLAGRTTRRRFSPLRAPATEREIKAHLNARRTGTGCLQHLEGCWSVAYGNTFVFTLPIEIARALTPKGLETIEVDGQGMCEVGFMEFDGNNLAADPKGFTELSFAVGIRPTAPGRERWMGWHTLMITADSEAFLDDAEGRVHLPVYRPKKLRYDRPGSEHDVTVVADEDPILTLQTDLRPCLNSCASYAVFAEVTSADADGLWRCGFGAMGSLSKTKGKPAHKRCVFHDHPFFRAIPMEGGTLDPRCLSTMPHEVFLAKPGVPLYQHFTPPEPYEPLTGP